MCRLAPRIFDVTCLLCVVPGARRLYARAQRSGSKVLTRLRATTCCKLSVLLPTRRRLSPLPLTRPPARKLSFLLPPRRRLSLLALTRPPARKLLVLLPTRRRLSLFPLSRPPVRKFSFLLPPRRRLSLLPLTRPPARILSVLLFCCRPAVDCRCSHSLGPLSTSSWF